MRSCSCRLAALALFLWCGTSLGAQASLGLEEVRAKVLAGSADLRQAGFSVEDCLLAEKAEASTWLPSLSVSAGGSLGYGSSATTPAGSLGISAAQRIWDGGASAVLLAIDRLATAQEREAARSAWFAAVSAADQAYYGVLAATDALAAAQADLEVARSSLELSRAKREAGLITKSDLLKAQAEAASKEAAYGVEAAALKKARTKLASLAGLEGSYQLEKIDFASWEGLRAKLAGLDEAGQDALAARLVAAARAANPDLASARLASASAGLALASAKTAWGPSISAAWSQKLGLDSGGVTTSGSLSLSASLALDYWNMPVALGRAKLKAATSASVLEETQRSLDLSVRTAVYDWAASATSIASMAAALDYAQGNYEAVLEAYKLSQATVTELSEAAALVSTNRSNLASARYTFLEDLAALKGYGAFESDQALLDKVAW